MTDYIKNSGLDPIKLLNLPDSEFEVQKKALLDMARHSATEAASIVDPTWPQIQADIRRESA